VTGSVASSILGAVRATNDIDIVAAFPEKDLENFYNQLKNNFYIDAQSIREAIRSKRSLNIVHLPTAFKIDIFISPGSPTDLSIFARAKTFQLGSEEKPLQVSIASAEDLILAKLKRYKNGGCVSSQQLQDIQGILRIQKSVDRHYLKVQAAK
jgi:acylphosphatase